MFIEICSRRDLLVMHTFVTSFNADSAGYTNLIKEETNHLSYDHVYIYIYIPSVGSLTR
jgi:hypothetical protein